MRIISFIFLGIAILGCARSEQSHRYKKVAVTTLYSDSLSIRAIDLLPGSLAFAANKGVYGSIDLQTGQIRTNIQRYDTLLPHFRAVAHTATDFFMLSIASPALLYKTGEAGQMQLVYSEKHPEVFYDSMSFWNDREGIAVGDALDGCLSIIITRDGGHSWEKLSCKALPDALKGEGAFAASNSNIALFADQTWIATSKSRVLYSPDKGKSWSVFETPIAAEKPTQGIYSIVFWDGSLGFAIGGDYTEPEDNRFNKAITRDGGQNWEIRGNARDPGYKSCVQFVPGSGGKDLVAVGFTGISYSPDQGTTWKKISDEPFFTIRFVNDSIAYGAGLNRISRLTFK